MIKRFFKLFRGREDAEREEEAPREPVVIPRAEHTVSRAQIDADALKVLNRLNRFDHTAYLVGGGVRDLLLGRPAKDFDIATSAHPNEIKKLFRNCRLIGRRFRLAHILFRGRKIIEVSTFRRHAGFGDDGDLLIKSDNTFGTPEEDARRRDFTVNGLFYNIANFSLIDYVNGLQDLNDKVVRTIGDPEIRFREDPIRILRAVRFAARLGFSIGEKTRSAMERHREGIWKGAVPRILEEVLRMLHQGSAVASWTLMDEMGILPELLPRLAADFASPEARERILGRLAALDAAPRRNNPPAPGLLAAVLYCTSCEEAVAEAGSDADRGRLIREVIEADLKKLNFPRMQLEKTRQLLLALDRLRHLGRKRIRPAQLAQKGYFDEALALLEIVDPDTPEKRSLVRRWRSQARRTRSGEEKKPEAAGEEEGTKPARRRRRRGGRRRRRSAAPQPAAPPEQS